MPEVTDIRPRYSKDPVINACVLLIMKDWEKLVEKAHRYGLDIRLLPECETLGLYFNEDYPNTILVDTAKSCKQRDADEKV